MGMGCGGYVSVMMGGCRMRWICECGWWGYGEQVRV